VNAEGRRDRTLVPLGYISGVHGVKGWVKVHSWTNPREAILDYQPWILGEEEQPVSIIDGRPQGKTIVAALPDVEDRDAARSLIGTTISVYRDQLPETEEDSWYWTDLVGLAVETASGVSLGRIDKMMETGTHDVMVVRGDRERLIPFVTGQVVLAVEPEEGRVVVDWEPEYLE
jgi:16S rRNA processing protein RimM